MTSQRRGSLTRSRRSIRQQIKRAVVETLEDRRLLTALFGGDEFAYQQAPGQEVHIQVQGNIMAEVVGGVVDDSNNLILTDLPGQWDQSSSGRLGATTLGGLAGRRGLNELGRTSIRESANFPQGSIGDPTKINFQALASTDTGNTYGFNVAPDVIIGAPLPNRKLVQLVQLDTGNGAGTVSAMIQQATLREDVARDTANPDPNFNWAGVAGNIGDVAIDPTTGLIYVVTTGAGSGNLYSIDRATGTVTLVGVIRNSFGAQLNNTRIDAMTFDNTGQLWIITQDYDNDPNTDASGLATGPTNPGPPPVTPTSNTDIALIAVNKADASFTPNDIHVIRTINTTDNFYYETLNSFTAMVFNAAANQFLVASLAPQGTGGGGGTGGQGGYELDTINMPAPGPVNAVKVGDIQVGGAGGGGGGGGGTGNLIDRVDGMTWAVNAAGNTILVGLQETAVNNALYPRLISINWTAPGTSLALSDPGSVVAAGGIASYTEPGDTKPLLWTATNTQLIRGSAVSLLSHDDGTSAVNAVRGAAFNPIDKLVYFVDDEDQGSGGGGGGGGTGTGGKNVLYTIDVNALTRSQIQNSISQIRGTFTHTPQGGGGAVDGVITSLAFDQTSGATTDLWGFDSQSGGLVRVNRGNTNGSFWSPQVYMIGAAGTSGTAIANDSVTGLAFYGDDLNSAIGDDPTRAQTYVYAIQNAGQASQIIRIRLSNPLPQIPNVANPPTEIPWGAVVAPHVHRTAGDMSGENLQDLTWNPAVPNPFTFQLGALMATDVDTDQLVTIDFRLRSPNVGLFNIHVTQSDANSSISIYQMSQDRADPAYDPTQPFYPIPFNGDTGSFRIRSYANPNVPQVVISSPGNIGQVLLGIKTNDVDCVTRGPINDDLKAILSAAETSADPSTLRAPITAPFGQVSVADDWIPQGLFAPSGGIIETVLAPVPGNPNSGPTNKMIGLNMDNIQAATASAAGDIYVFDSDRSDNTRTYVPNDGDQMAIIRAGTNQATNLVNVHDFNGVPLPRIQGAHWGDPTNSGTPSLYAVYSIGGVPTLGTIDADPTSNTYGLFTEIGPVGGATPVGAVEAMAISPTQRLYIVDDTGSLYQVDPTTGNLSGAALASNLPTIKSMDFDGRGNLYAEDIQNGRLVDINLNTGVVGGVLATPDGSVRASIGAITFDPNSAKFWALDNALSREYLQSITVATDRRESAMLLQVVGLTNLSVVPQDIGKFLFGGTVMGQVNVSGSIGTFYAGWLPIGASGGQRVAAPVVPENFKVGGELRDLEILTSIGTNDATALAGAVYDTGFDLRAGGRVGAVHAINDIIGSATVDNSGLPGTAMPLSTVQHEFEPNSPMTLTSAPLPKSTDPQTVGGLFSRGWVSNPAFWNDTFQTAQYLGVIDSSLGNNVVQLWGSIGGDNTAPDAADYYSVALLAGQSIVVQLIDQPGSLIGCFEHVGVYDPDGRLIATDFSDVDPDQYFHKPFVIKTDRPGLYRFAIGVLDVHPLPIGDYELRIMASTDGSAGVGNIGLGAVAAGGNIFDGRSAGSEFVVGKGDLGGIAAGAFFASQSFPTVAVETAYNVPVPPPAADAEVGATIDVLNGNMRAIDSKSVGRYIPPGQPGGPAYTLGVDVHAINGTVGLIRSYGTDANDMLYLNKGVLFNGPPRVSDHDLPGVARQVASKGDYQLVSSNTLYVGAIMSNTAIGVVRAQNMPSGASFFVANADNTTNDDGVIDLIYDAGDLGNPLAGGPAIITGPGGDLRYMVVGGIAWRDQYFGQGVPEETNFQPGEGASFNDDSGAQVYIAPQATAPGQAPPSLHITTYGVRGSGGVAVVNVRSDSGVSISGASLDPSIGVEIGSVQAGGATPFVSVSGTTRVDVFQTTGAAFTDIANSTGGEFVNIDASSIQRLQAGYIGVATRHTPMLLNALPVRTNVFPFVQQQISINAGSIGLVAAKHSIANLNVSGTIGQVVADSDRLRAPGDFDGIVGPIFGGAGITDVSIGQGISSSGTGAMGLSGVFSNGRIQYVHGDNADIRGNIVSAVGITRISLTNNGSIIGANVMVISDISQSHEYDTAFQQVANGSPVTNPIFQIGAISVTGATPPRGGVTPTGGIMGVYVLASHIGPVTVTRGFGLIDSTFQTAGDGVMKGFTIDGYGIRDVNLFSGAYINNMIVTGKGQPLQVNWFSPAVRYSEYSGLVFRPGQSVDDFSPRFIPNRTDDLHRYLGTDPGSVVPLRAEDYTTNAGVISGTTAKASRELTQLKAWMVWPSNRLGVYRTCDFDVANRLKYFDVIRDAFDIQITTGNIVRMSIGGYLTGPSITVSGIFSLLQVGGGILQQDPTQTILPDYGLDGIFAIGPNGQVATTQIGGGLDLPIKARKKIGKWSVGGRYSTFGKFGPRGSIWQGNRQIAP